MSAEKALQSIRHVTGGFHVAKPPGAQKGSPDERRRKRFLLIEFLNGEGKTWMMMMAMVTA